MNKKLILLILLLPLVLMFCIFTTTNSISINVDVPVSSIEITGNKIVYLDMDIDEKHLVKYTVYPLTAKNKKVSFITEQVGTQEFAELEFDDGYIIPKSVGVAKVYLSTIDGGFKDSFIVKVEATKVQEIECVATKTQLMVGETSVILTSFNPSNVKNKMLNYESSDLNVVQVNEKGIIKGIGKGNAIITISSEENPKVKDTIEVEVYNENIMDLAQTEVYTWKTNGSINISVDTDENYELEYDIKDLYGNPISNVIKTDDTGIEIQNKEEGKVLFNYNFEESFYGSVLVEITITTDNEIREPLTKTCVIHRIEQITASFDSEDVISCVAGSPFALHNKITVNPENADYSYDVILDNDNLRIDEVSNRIRLTALLPGVTNLTLKVINNALPDQVVTLTKEIVILPTDMDIAEQANTYGIENLWTIGKYEANGGLNTSKVNLLTGKTEVGLNFIENFSYTTDNDNVSVEKDGTIKILDDNFDGVVKITGKFGYKNIETSTSEFSVRCVGEGVNIRNFYDLYNASKNNKVIVLQKTIKNDFGKDKSGKEIYSESTVEKINSTYDTTYYKNIDKLSDAKVKILISFKNDVYGNGYQINAHNVAYGLDSTGKLKKDALFRGPLNFVSMSESSTSFVSVKAQDNISFAVYENVTLNNVVLSSCELQADKDGNYDLTDLTYVGSTVEVLGDNVNIEYCRINNGRTVLRAFGDIENKNKVINVNIKNSVLSSAREFIIRMGTNSFVDGNSDNPSPYLDTTERKFPMQKEYNSMSAQEKLSYEEKYIKTFVNLKNTILKDSGLFCIGIDTHFSGGALADGRGLASGLIDSWYDLAKTSYGAKLTFEGDVRMYDWKEVDKVDSSALIEILGNTSYDSLSFDLKEMIDTVANNSSKPQYKTIVYKKSGKQYVHGGIAFFGGGKNYGVYEAKDYDFKILNGYEISLSDVDKLELQVAAGTESFYFLMNDATTQGFSPEDQTKILNSSDAYSPIYKIYDNK